MPLGHGCLDRWDYATLHPSLRAIDPAKIQTELGWRPEMTFQSGMAATIDWYLANTAWVNAVIDGSYQRYYAEMYGNIA